MNLYFILFILFSPHLWSTKVGYLVPLACPLPLLYILKGKDVQWKDFFFFSYIFFIGRRSIFGR